MSDNLSPAAKKLLGLLEFRRGDGQCYLVDRPRARTALYVPTMLPSHRPEPVGAFNAADRTVSDLGDITGLPGLVVQVKDVARANIPAWMRETEAQRDAANADHGLLVQRRRGTTDVGKWWVHLTGKTFAVLMTGRDAPDFDCIARVTLAELVPLLHRAGYGTGAVA